MHRTIYHISDGTGITAETLGHSLITQFGSEAFKSITLPYVNTREKAEAAVLEINKSCDQESLRPIVFSTIVESELRSIIAKAKAFVIDFFQTFIAPLETELKIKASKVVGLSHAVTDLEQYTSRIDSIHYALHSDDGLNIKSYESAEIILLGVSRTGKTPTSLYLAMQYGIRVANFPLTEDTLNTPRLPAQLAPYRDRIYGLTIAAERLHQIRQKRYPDSRYSSLKQCQEEINQAEFLFKEESIPFINSTHLSIEELSAHILKLYS